MYIAEIAKALRDGRLLEAKTIYGKLVDAINDPRRGLDLMQRQHYAAMAVLCALALPDDIADQRALDRSIFDTIAYVGLRSVLVAVENVTIDQRADPHANPGTSSFYAAVSDAITDVLNRYDSAMLPL